MAFHALSAAVRRAAKSKLGFSAARFAFGPADVAGWAQLAVVPAVVEELGDERYVLFDLDAPRVDTEATRAALDARSSDDALLLPGEARARFTVRLPADLPLAIGSPLTVSVDPRRLYFFDPDTGSALHGSRP